VLPELPSRNRKAKNARQRLADGVTLDGLDVVVTNYDSIRAPVLLAALTAWDADLIVCDEAQRIKNQASKQSKCAWQLGDQARYKLLLTGTPVCNSPLDLWSQFRFLDPSVFGRSWWAFRAHYAIMGGYENKETLGVRYLGELSKKAHSIASRVRKEEALDLPEYVTETYYCELEPNTRKLYDQMRDRGGIELYGQHVTAPVVIARMNKLSQLTGGWVASDEGPWTRVSYAKESTCEDIVFDILESDPERKVVIFCHYVEEIKALGESIRKHWSRRTNDVETDIVRVMWGDTPKESRGEIVQEFQTDPAIRVFIAQTHTAGLGITLHAADTVIFYSPDFSYADYAQARDRIHRIGQTKPCTCIHLCARNTIDELAFSALAAKKGLADACVDNWRSILGKG